MNLAGTSQQDLERRGGRPKPEDFRLAESLAQKIVSVGGGRVRRVVMIGSRACGYARADSDLDLVAIVELPPKAKPWNGADADRERDRIQAAVGTPPISTDLTVRSAAQFEEARRIIGGVERLVETEGIEVYSDAFEFPPHAQRRPADVQLALVRAWVEAAINTVAKGIAAGRGQNSAPRLAVRISVGLLSPTVPMDGVLKFVVRPVNGQRDESSFWSRSIRQAITALEVMYQVDAAKHDDLTHVLARLEACCPEPVREIRTRLQNQGVCLAGAKSVIVQVIAALPSAVRKSPWSGHVRRKLDAESAVA